MVLKKPGQNVLFHAIKVYDEKRPAFCFIVVVAVVPARWPKMGSGVQYAWF